VELKDAGALKQAAKGLAGTATKYGEILASFLEGTTVGVLKSVALFFGWPILVGVKATHWGFRATEAITGAIGGIFETVRKWGVNTLEAPFSGGFLEKAGQAALKLLVALPASIVGGVIEFAAKAPKYVAGLFRWAIDSDMWFRKRPVTTGAAVGFIGGTTWMAISIGMILAGIPTLGIAPAIWFGGTAIAMLFSGVGAIIAGRNAAKKKALQLNTLSLQPEEAMRLADDDNSNRKKIAAASTPTPTVPTVAPSTPAPSASATVNAPELSFLAKLKKAWRDFFSPTSTVVVSSSTPPATPGPPPPPPSPPPGGSAVGVGAAAAPPSVPPTSAPSAALPSVTSVSHSLTEKAAATAAALEQKSKDDTNNRTPATSLTPAAAAAAATRRTRSSSTPTTPPSQKSGPPR